MPTRLAPLVALVALLAGAVPAFGEDDFAWRLEPNGRVVLCRKCTVEIRAYGSATLLGSAQVPDKRTGTFSTDAIPSSGLYCITFKSDDGAWTHETCRPHWRP